ncbi:MAG: hypothetical protein PHI23_05105 [Candidatus Peribacteraceae bacterium]|nr:hypothetical protein [Candidatus Peribacteraceae bacterium]
MTPSHFEEPWRYNDTEADMMWQAMPGIRPAGDPDESEALIAATSRPKIPADKTETGDAISIPTRQLLESTVNGPDGEISSSDM